MTGTLLLDCGSGDVEKLQQGFVHAAPPFRSKWRRWERRWSSERCSIAIVRRVRTEDIDGTTRPLVAMAMADGWGSVSDRILSKRIGF